MKKILLVLLLLIPSYASSNCCRVLSDGYYMRIHNMSSVWVSCYVGYYTFQIPPGGVSRAYPNDYWGCR